MTTATRKAATLPALSKAPTGIVGLDEITGGGLPLGRPTLVYGGAGSGKTLMGLEFLIRGATEYDEPGVFISFEETEQELATNVSSLHFDIEKLVNAGKLFVDYIELDRSQMEEVGEYDLEGLFVRLNSAIDSIQAKRVVLDTIEVLFAQLGNAGIIRAELHRLFRWLKRKGVTTLVTGERGGESILTRHGIEEYVSDCVIFLDNRVKEELATRRLRIVKYRGSAHSPNEFPFIIDEEGISLLPVTSSRLDYPVSDERFSTGVPRLDQMLGGTGFIKGSAILVSGVVGTGKSSLAAHYINAGSKAGHRCLYFAFEEAPAQIIRNMKSIGIDLAPWVDKGLLRFQASRVSELGLEKHLMVMQRAVKEFQPELVVFDSLTAFESLGAYLEVRQMILRMIDFFKTQGMTVLCTSMSQPLDQEETGVGLSSLFDTWIHLSNVQSNLERNRTLVIVKSRGMAHSNQVREFNLTESGIELTEIYATHAGAFLGTAREAQKALDEAAELRRREDVSFRERQLEDKRRALDARIAAMRAEFEVEATETSIGIAQEKARDEAVTAEYEALKHHREQQESEGA